MIAQLFNYGGENQFIQKGGLNQLVDSRTLHIQLQFAASGHLLEDDERRVKRVPMTWDSP